MTCSSCGAAVPSGARFCPSCGKPAAVRGDERRVATVVFVDIVGFTQLSESADPEQVKNLVDSCFARLAEDVGAFGGKVDKVVGDALVALFGAPVAHEDDAERAVRAALRMQATVDSFAEHAGAPLRVRIGVNTGEVLVGGLRAGGDYTAMGDVVNTAQRLQTTASPGSVVVGPATHGATHAVIAYRPLGALVAKGREQPVEAWEALEALLPPGHRPRRHVAPLVGRDAELSVCTDVVDLAVRRGRGAVVVLLGEAGMGKSRLAAEIGERARDRHGAQVHEGRCAPYGEANVWWPIADAVRATCGLAPDASRFDAQQALRAIVDTAAPDPSAPTSERSHETDADDDERTVQGLLHVLGHEGALRGIEPAHASEEARWSVLRFFEGLAHRAPLVLVLSDVHWADDAVLELARGLLDRLARTPFVLVATARGAPPAPLVATERHNAVVLTLDPLDRASAAELLEVISAGEVPAGLREAVLDRSGGNPLYLEELAALLADVDEADAAGPIGSAGISTKGISAGAIRGGAGGGAGVGGGVTAGAGTSEIPDTLRGLVAARIDALGPAERNVLEDAAVWGRSGPVLALEQMGHHVHGLAAPVVERALAVLSDRDMLGREGRRWTFRSDLVREVAYATLTKADRARRHNGIAWFLEYELASMDEASDRTVDVIAHHYRTAAELVRSLGPVSGVGDDVDEQALTWLEEAARRASVAQLPEVARRLLDQGLDLAGESGTERRVRLLLAHASACIAAGDVAAARVDVDEALRSAHDLGSEALIGSGEVALGEVQQREGAVGEAVETLSGAVRRFEALGDVAAETDALRALGMTLLFAADRERATATITAALDRYRSLGDARGEAWALQHLAWIAYVAGDATGAEERLVESIAGFEALGDRGGLNWARGLLAFVKYHQGDLDAARRLGEDVLVETAERGDRWGHAMMLLLASGVALWSGRAHEGRRIAAEAVDTFEALGDRFGASQATIALARTLVTGGDVAEGVAVLERACEQFGEQGHPDDLRPALLVGLANAYVQLGSPVEALAALDRLDDDDRDESLGDVESSVARALAQVQLGDPEGALVALGTTLSDTAAAARAPYAAAVGALALAGAGRGVEEVEAWATPVLDGRRGTYLDHLTARLASVLTRCRARGADEISGFDQLDGVLEGTDDEVARAVVATARAEALAVLGLPGADAAHGDAEERWAVLGTNGTGWAVAARVALSGSAEV